MSRRALLLALAIAALTGFAMGWMARGAAPRTIEERARETYQDIRERLQRFGR